MGIRGSGLAGVIPTGRSVLIGLPHIAELRTGEHVGTFGHPRDIRLVHIGGWLVHPLQLLQLHRAVTIVPLGERILVEGALVGMPAKLPVDATKIGMRLGLSRCQRTVMGQRHIGCNDADAEARVKPGGDRLSCFIPGKPSRNGRPAKTDIGRRLGMRLGIEPEEPQIIGNDDRRFG